VPALPPGATAFSSVLDTKVTDDDSTEPNSTLESEVNPVPTTVTVFPPANAPASGSTLVTDGAPYVYQSAEDVELQPAGFDTRTSTLPALPAGATAFSSVLDTKLTDDDSTEPNSTHESEVNPVPTTVTVFPPPNAPASGSTFVTDGAPYVY
jgi:hypothetical protein